VVAATVRLARWLDASSRRPRRLCALSRQKPQSPQLTRFVTTDDEKELRKHWTRIARVEDMHKGIIQLAACCNDGAVA
jgi:hypothetical protein